MKNARTIARPLAAAALLAAAAAATTACQSTGARSGPISTAEHQIDDLRLSLDAQEGRHVIVVTTPTEGWRVDVDETFEMADKVEIFITATKPRGMYAQVLEPHRKYTDLDAAKPIDVNIRVVERTVSEAKGPYKPVAFVPEDDN
jgi:hypothetical protein